MSAEVSGLHIRGKAALAINMPADTPPPGWAWVPLNVVARQETGHTPSRQHPEWWGGDVAWIGLRDARLHHGTRIYDTQQTTNALGLANSSARLLPAGTVCLSRTASVGYVTIMGRAMATSQDFVTWTCSEALLPDFLMKALIAEGDDIRKFGKGTTHTTIYFPEVRAMHICLPPPAEQKRIVAKLDALTAKSARARAELARIDTLVSRYKQAVLAKAFSGDLTAEWRDGKLWPQTISLGDAATSFTYGSAAKSSPSGKIPVLRMGNIVAGSLDWSDLVYTSDESEIKKYELRAGDVLFNRTNSPALVGKTALYRGERPAIYAGYLIKITVGSALMPEYLTYALNSPAGRTFSWEAKTDGVSQSNISATKLRDFRFAVPSLREQHEIVRRIEAAFARIDRLAAEAKRALALLGRLDEAILAKAFRGELVPQDPADEPASVLLDRIRAERAAAPKVKRGRRLKT